MKCRRGFSLIELMVAMGTGSALMVIAIAMVHRAMTIHSGARQHDALQQTALRLSRQFRRDLHRAESAVLAAGKLSLTFPQQQPQPPLTYTFAEGSVLREQARESGQSHRETYQFVSCSQIAVSQLSEPPRIELQVRQNGIARGMPPRVVLQVQATVGCGLRLDPRPGATR